MAQGSAGDGDLAGVDGLVPDGQLEDRAHVGHYAGSALGGGLRHVVVAQAGEDLQHGPATLPHEGQDLLGRWIVGRIGGGPGAHPELRLVLGLGDRLFRGQQGDHEVVDRAQVPRNPEGRVRLVVHLEGPLLGGPEGRKERLGDLTDLVELPLYS